MPDVEMSERRIDLYKTCLGQHLIAYEALKAQKRPSSGDFIEEIQSIQYDLENTPL